MAIVWDEEPSAAGNEYRAVGRTADGRTFVVQRIDSVGRSAAGRYTFRLSCDSLPLLRSGGSDAYRQLIRIAERTAAALARKAGQPA